VLLARVRGLVTVQVRVPALVHVPVLVPGRGGRRLCRSWSLPGGGGRCL